MSKLQALITYQTIDQKLYKIDNDFSKSEAYQKYGKLRKFLKVAPEKVEALEGKAVALKTEVSLLMQQYDKVEATLKEFDNVEELLEGGADISFYKKNVKTILDTLKKLKADLTALTESIKATDAEYQALKKKVIAAQKQYKAAEEEYKVAKEPIDKEREGYKTQLNELAKEIDEELLNRYLNKRKEGTEFPIVAQLQDGRCPLCGMQPPIVAQGQFGIECDTCHRILFSE